MPTPIQCPSTRGHESVEALIHGVTSTPDEIHLDATPPVVHDASTAEELTESAVVHGVAHVAANVVGESIATPAAVLFELLHGAASDFRAGREEGELYEYDKMRGALAFFEGRSEDPSVVRERDANPAFADGLRRGHAVWSNDSELCGRVLRAVDATVTEGYAAVVSGNDHGARFDRRYGSDLCFRHAVDYARGQRDSGGDRWPVIEARVAENCTLADAAIAQVPMRA